MSSVITLPQATLVTAHEIVQRDVFIAGNRFTTPATPIHFEINLRGHWLLPALINAHDHLQLNAVPPLVHAQPFANSYAWIAAFQPHFEEAAVKAVLAVPSEARHWHGGLKNALCGATTVMHHDPLKPVLQQPDFPVRVLPEYGWAHSLSLKYGPSVSESFAATPPNHSWFIHLAEGTDKVALGELAALDALGCLRSNTVLIHGVGLSDADIERTIAWGASVVWCPASNLAMLGQTVSPARLRKLFDAGCLMLGTDSRLTGAFDLLDELRVAEQHSDLRPRELFQLVTSDASRLLRMNNVGSIQPGQFADALIVRQTNGDPYAALLQLHRSDIRAVVKDGQPLVTDPDFEAWFTACRIPFTRIQLDGRAKLCATSILCQQAVALEPGLKLP